MIRRKRAASRFHIWRSATAQSNPLIISPKADFVACHNPSYMLKGYKIVNDVKPGGTFLLNCQWTPEDA